MAKFCPECANPIVGGAFCSKCGAKLPTTSPEVQTPAAQPNAIKQPAQPSYYTPPVNTVPTSFSESKSNERSFYYSNFFYLVIILDLIISFIVGIFCVSMSLNPTSRDPFYYFLGIILPINLIIDIYILNNIRHSPHVIDTNSCWIKSLLGFLGIFTVISGLYFFIISMKMHHTSRQLQDSTTDRNTKKGFVNAFLKDAEDLERLIGAYYHPKTVEETAKEHGYDLTTLSPAKNPYLLDLAKADYDLYIVRRKYKLANSSLGPTVLGILGVISIIYIVGILILIVALIWYLIRVNSRPQLYQEIKDLETRCAELKKKIETP